MKYKLRCIIVTVYLFSQSIGLEYNKQRYTQNTDFLLHEAGINPNTPKKENVAPSNFGNNRAPPNSDPLKSDFPPLGPTPSLHIPKASQNTRTTQTSAKRDYVAPNYPSIQTPKTTQPAQPSHNPQSSGNRNNVATGLPTLQPAASSQGKLNSYSNPKPTQMTQPAGKRDYVNPNIPSNNPNTEQGKVKHLVNFYDGKSQPNNPQKTPSYSSILQGAMNNQGSSISQPPTPTVQTQTHKPLSYSEVISGSNSNRNTATSIKTTVKPFSKVTSTPMRPTNPTHPATRRPLVPPSSVLNNNHGNNAVNNRNSVTETELQTLSEELLRKDTNNAARYITINYQGKTTSQSLEDKAPLPLLTVSQEAWNIPTIQTFVALLDNYERDTLVNEHVTPQERIEENSFMDAIMSTTVIRHLMNFFKEKGYVTPDPKQQRDFLKQLWFTLYSRGKGKISSSGFEHSFVSELKNGEVSGLHNWIYFSKEEQANRLNYLGYLKYEEFNGKGAVMKLHFNQQGVDKPVDSLFIGTSPELEIALYTLCYVTRVDNDCRLKLSGKDVNIITYNFRYRSKNLIGSAYPQI
ncbi:hypothetical protein evm_008875 [Chilo suppressalis]|nr:hypothetical protein evm_008875 [Chilo suppressalis]